MTELEFFNTLSAKIRFRRTFLQIDQQKLANMVDLHPTVLNKIEAGTRKINAYEAVKIAKALETTLDQLTTL